MDEQKDKKEDKSNNEENIGDGDKSKTISELDRADQIAERQKRENDRREELLIREEQLQARKVIGGETEAGKTVEKKEETPLEYKNRILKGEL